MNASGWAQTTSPADAPSAPGGETQDTIIIRPDGGGTVHARIISPDHARKLAEEMRARAEQQAELASERALYFSSQSGKKEKAAFLGVVSVPADASLRNQLKIQRGIGLVVRNVTGDSPAAASGLKEHDVLLKLDDQWLVNPSQLGVLVRMHKADDEVTLTVMREGQQQTLKAKLAEREMVIPESTEGFGESGELNRVFSFPQALPVPGVPMAPDVVRGLIDDDADLIIRDGGQTMKVSMKDQQRHLVVTDENGQVAFDGPIQTDEQLKSVPADIAEKLEKYKEQIDSVKEAGGKKRIRILRDQR
jgi:hypothetical protein